MKIFRYINQHIYSSSQLPSFLQLDQKNIFNYSLSQVLIHLCFPPKTMTLGAGLSLAFGFIGLTQAWKLDESCTKKLI